MKYKLTLLILISCLLSNCTNKNEEKKYETVWINFDPNDEIEEAREDRYEKMSIEELIDSLKLLSPYEGVIRLKSSEELFGNQQSMGKYYENNIPRSAYKRIFPNEDIVFEKLIDYEKTVDEKERKIFMRKRKKVTEERKYKYLYSLVEKKDYIQILMTIQGKYQPEIELITLSKKGLEKIGNKNVFGGIYDSYDIDYWKSEFDENHEGLKMIYIKNKSFEEVNLDTIELEFKINERGEILKNN